jgi:hypothetical protein
MNYARGVQGGYEFATCVRVGEETVEEINHRIMNNDGTEKPVPAVARAGDTMTKNCTVTDTTEPAGVRCQAG